MAIKATKISFFIYVMHLHLDFYIKNVALQEIILQADVLRAIQAKPVSVGSCATLVEWSRWQALQRLLHDCKVSVPGDVSTALRSAQHDIWEAANVDSKSSKKTSTQTMLQFH